MEGSTGVTAPVVASRPLARWGAWDSLWWGFLTLLLGLAIWMCATGNVMLRGFPLEVLEGLARGKGVALPVEAPRVDGTAMLGSLPGDSLAWASAVTALLNGLGALALYLAGYRTWRNLVSPLLAVGVAYFGANTVWVDCPTPGQASLHFLLAGSLAALLMGSVPVMAGLVLALAVLSPPHAVMIFLALAFLGYRRQEAYGLFVPTLALFGVGCLLIPLTAGYRLQPSFDGWQASTLVPLLLALLPGPVREARGGIYLAFLLGSALTGTPELASVLALGDLAFEALERCAATCESKEVETGRPLSGRLLVGVLATLALVLVVLPGERYLNRRILIPAQKADLPLPRLLGVFSLRSHARLFPEDEWRAKVPFPELTAGDFALALDLAQTPLEDGFCPLTLDGRQESRRVALVYALASGQALRGWDSPRHLGAPLLLCKLRERNFILEGPAVIFRKDGQARVADRPPVIKDPVPLDFRNVLLLPYRVQRVSQQPGASYRWTSNISLAGEGQTCTLSFPDQVAEVMLSSQPGEYRLNSPAGAVRHFEMPAVVWELSDPRLASETLPSRSLVPLRLRLANKGFGPVSSDMLASWRVEPVEGASFSSFLQRTPKKFILYPGESTELELMLATPEPEGVFPLRVRAVTPEGDEMEIPLVAPSSAHTWRRLPPVGTWVEEP